MRKGTHLTLMAFARISRSAATLTLVGHLQKPAATSGRYAALAVTLNTELLMDGLSVKPLTSAGVTPVQDRPRLAGCRAAARAAAQPYTIAAYCHWVAALLRELTR